MCGDEASLINFFPNRPRKVLCGAARVVDTSLFGPFSEMSSDWHRYRATAKAGSREEICGWRVFAMASGGGVL